MRMLTSPRKALRQEQAAPRAMHVRLDADFDSAVPDDSSLPLRKSRTKISRSRISLRYDSIGMNGGIPERLWVRQVPGGDCGRIRADGPDDVFIQRGQRRQDFRRDQTILHGNIFPNPPVAKFDGTFRQTELYPARE